LNMFIGTQSGTSPVTFSATPCSGMPAETTCTANSPSVQSTSSDLLNLSATAPHSDTRRSAYQSLPDRWITATFMLFGGVLLIGAFSPKRRPRKLLLLPMVMLIIILASCGGGSGSSGTGGGGTGGGGTGGGGGTTDPGTPVGTYTITVMATSGSISHGTNFTLIVQ